MIEVRQPPQKRRSLFWPLLLIALGLFLFLNTLGILPGSSIETLLRLWPLLFILGGLDNLYQREGYVSAIIEIGLGTLFLLSNLNILTLSIWDLLLKVWPVFIIGWGLDLIIGHKGWLSAGLGALLGLAIIAAIVWVAVLAPVGLSTPRALTFSQPLQGATTAEMNFNSPVGELRLQGGAAADNLVDGVLALAPRQKIEPAYQVVGQHGTLDLSSYGSFNFTFGNANQPVWDLKLNQSVPLNLKAEMGAGSMRADLSGLTLKDLNLKLGVGQLDVTLPAGSWSGRLECAVGEMIIRVPQNAALRLHLERGIAGVSLPDGYTREGTLILSPGASTAGSVIDLQVNQPVGGVRILTRP